MSATRAANPPVGTKLKAETAKMVATVAAATRITSYGDYMESMLQVDDIVYSFVADTSTSTRRCSTCSTYYL